jgi:hypothetical protein
VRDTASTGSSSRRETRRPAARSYSKLLDLWREGDVVRDYGLRSNCLESRVRAAHPSGILNAVIRHHAHYHLAARLCRAAVTTLLIACAPGAWSNAVASEPLEPDDFDHSEKPDDPPGVPASLINGTTAAATISFGRFTHIQVNVNAAGQNIVRDAANEPSIAVDPNDPSRIAIGWRQFDTDKSNFRQAGFGYSTDGGLSWTAGTIDPGVFRSDPVLAYDAQGKFYYNSSTLDFHCQVFPSTNGGMTWGPLVPAYGGDKQWMTIDRTGGPGHDHIYELWSTAANPTPGLTFSRSVDGGQSYQSPSAIPNQPIWGTLDVAADGTLYVVGRAVGTNYVSRSTNARDAAAAPTFTTVVVDLGGTLRSDVGPNPAGLLGQPWIAVDRSTGPRSGWVYVLASVRTTTDSLDVMFIRSTDGGQTWSTPVRVNDDPAGNGAWQWFGTMSVSPEGRIDAVWNDTRGSANINQSALYYSFSTDGGTTWSPNEQASPVWDSTVGWPKQHKIGDYYHMISSTNGADLAWAATFNGEQDVYYLRIPGSTTAVATDRTERLRLRRGVPNPFSSSTTIQFEVPAAGERAKLEVFDAAGRRVATLVDGMVPGGTQRARWMGIDDSGRAVKPGLYLCRLQSAGVTETLKLMLLR